MKRDPPEGMPQQDLGLEEVGVKTDPKSGKADGVRRVVRRISCASLVAV